MKPPNENHTTQSDPANLPEQRTTGRCSSGCGCHPGSSAAKVCWVFVMLVLVVIGFLVFNFINKSGEVDARTSRSSFIVPASATTPPAENPAATVADTDTTPTTPFVGTMIGAFAELNTVAADSNAVFVYLPGKDGETVHEVPETSMRKAAKTIETNMGVKVGLYTLRPDSPDYGPLAGQMILPGVIAMVKGGGMVPLSGEITASDLMQGFMSAVGTGGCSSGCR